MKTKINILAALVLSITSSLFSLSAHSQYAEGIDFYVAQNGDYAMLHVIVKGVSDPYILSVEKQDELGEFSSIELKKGHESTFDVNYYFKDEISGSPICNYRVRVLNSSNEIVLSDYEEFESINPFAGLSTAEAK